MSQFQFWGSLQNSENLYLRSCTRGMLSRPLLMCAVHDREVDVCGFSGDHSSQRAGEPTLPDHALAAGIAGTLAGTRTWLDERRTETGRELGEGCGHLLRNGLAGFAFPPHLPVPELCQNPICFEPPGLLFEREQFPQVIDNKHFRIEPIERLEPGCILRNQQVAGSTPAGGSIKLSQYYFPTRRPSDHCTRATEFEKRPVFSPVASYCRLVPPVNATCLATIAV